MDWARFQSATELRDSGRAEEAVREFRLLETEVNGPDEKAALLINQHRCYCELSRLDEADRVLTQIRRLAPSEPDVCLVVDFGEACMHILMGQLEKGLKEFDELLQRYPDLLACSQHPLYESIQRRRGVVLSNLGRYAEAIPVLKQSAVVSSLSAEDGQEVHLFLGVCYDQVRERTLAKEEYLKAISFGLKTELEAHARYRIASLYFSVGAFAQAKLHLEAILLQYSGDIPNLPKETILELLSRTCHYLGEENEPNIRR